MAAEWREKVEPSIAAGCELWHCRTGDGPVARLGLAAVRDGKVIEWWAYAYTG